MVKRTTLIGASEALHEIMDDIQISIGVEVKSRGYRVANELQNSLNNVLSGQRSGRRYKVPGTFKRQRDKVSGKMRNGVYYTASAPGEAPANRTGHFRTSFHRRVFVDSEVGHNFHVHGVTESRYQVKNGDLLGAILEYGTSRMAPRPYIQRTLQMARPSVVAIYSEPYRR